MTDYFKKEDNTVKKLPPVFPIHGMILVQDMGDPTLGGLFDATESAEEIGVVLGKVVRTGNGFVTKEGIIPLATIIGSEVIFLKEDAIPLSVFPDFYYLIDEARTSGTLSRDPFIGEIPEFTGVDVDKIFNNPWVKTPPEDEL